MRFLYRPLTREPADILVMALCPIGDTLFLTPALARLRERFRAARITVVLSPANEGILVDNPAVDARMYFRERSAAPGLLRFAQGVRRISRLRPDLIVNFSAAGDWITLLAGLRAPRLSIDMPFLWTVFGTRNRAFRRRHAIDHYLRVVEPVAGPCDDTEARIPRFYLTDAARREARALLVADGVKPTDMIVTLHVGGDGFGGRKRWEPERFARVANALVERYDARILIVGGKADLAATDAALALIPRNARSLVGKTSLGVTAALIEASALFIGNDSSPLHLAAAVGAPAVGVYGPSDWGVFQPVGRPGYRIRALHSDLPCAPCFRFIGNAPLWKPNPCYSYACLKAIDSRQVLAAAVELLGSGGRTSAHTPATLPESH